MNPKYTFASGNTCLIVGRVLYFSLGMIAFAASYATLNHKQLVAKLLYRWAAYDQSGAFLNFSVFSMQALIFLLVIVLVPRMVFGAVLFFVFLSGLVNAVYGRILGTYIDLGGMSWMLGEFRQLVPAFFQFWSSFLFAFVEVSLATAFFVLSRYWLRPVAKNLLGDHGLKKCGVVVVAFFLLSGCWGSLIDRTQAAEINVYSLAVRSLMQSYPEHDPVLVIPQASSINKIVWVVDESTSYEYFESVMQPGLSDRYGAIDFGESSSMANCSSPSNAALRWGVDVGKIDAATDLRRNPTIWSYAIKAGYKTVLIDGQVSGSPQNMVWPPEMKLIKEFYADKSGIVTDRNIGVRINRLISSGGKVFIYAVLRGSHYQYSSNYPVGDLPEDAGLINQYKHSIEYSKTGFFSEIFSGVNRDEVAVIYTSDHGQVLKQGVTPHCNTVPFGGEFSVPLLAFLPESLSNRWREYVFRGSGEKHSHSQIFPTTLTFMGYASEYAESVYDNPLPFYPKRLVTFGKRLVPEGDELIDVYVNRSYPLL